ncbi:MAG: RNA polymerase sigma factor (sigma-70 family) [Arcticibacterium sp.]|jgi:RNA polymerase sigma factor (sigma-70 family)
MVSILTGIFGLSNLELAEDVVQDTLLQALNLWKIKGIPDKPSSWLFTVAKNKAIDHIRKHKHSENFDFTEGQHTLLKSEYTISAGLEYFWKEEIIEDQQLKMMYICCDPALNPESQIALILKTLCGFSTAEIAKALLASKDTISKRLFGSKEHFRKHKTRFDLPEREQLKSRTSQVLNAIYLLFNEGYSSSHHKEFIRQDLIENAISLTKLLFENPHTSNPEAAALLALICFHTAREDSRLDQNGVVLLEKQDRTKWNGQLIKIGVSYLDQASSGDRISSYHLEAAIAYQHCISPSFEETDWQSILNLYDILYKVNPSPIIALNRVVVFEKVHGTILAKKELQKANEAGQLDNYYLYYSLFGSFHQNLQQHDEALISFTKAVSLTESENEKDLIRKKIKGLKS